MRRLLGNDAVAAGPGGVVLTVPSGQRIRLDKADAVGLLSMTLRVADLDHTERLFIDNDVAFVRDGETITVSPSDACGTTLHFTEAAPG
jgi:hypothetical protein